MLCDNTWRRVTCSKELSVDLKLVSLVPEQLDAIYILITAERANDIAIKL